jgi:hypothetical protein
VENFALLPWSCRQGPWGKESKAGKRFRQTILPTDFADDGQAIDRFQLLGFLEPQT